ncbi:hypothetical protein Taro_052030, partial [Colocasia esculenta]|nr:hypothetical protein [Colocasia esculenta]
VVKRRPVVNRWCLFPSVRKEDLCIRVFVFLFEAMASRGRHYAQAHDDEQRREEMGEQQAPAPQGPTVLPPPPPMDYGMFMNGLVQAIQIEAQTQAALQA